MKKTEGTFLSSDKKTELHYIVCAPDTQPTAVVQLIHGMCEYTERYAEFAEYLAENGVVFCGFDNLGHGQSAAALDDLGYFGEEGGAENLVADVREFYLTMRKKYRRLPYVMLGHSMGSFILRDYMVKFGATEDSTGTRLDGAILAGTSGTEKPVKLGLILANMMVKFKGSRYRSKYLRSVALKDYNKRYASDGDYGWMTRDRDVRAKFEADERCSFNFTAAGYRDMLTLLRDVSTPEWATTVPLSLPVFIIGGSEDPVGDYGKGPLELADALRDAEVNEVDVTVYDGFRHELLFEVGRERVYSDVLEFVHTVADGVRDARMAAAQSGFYVPLTTMGDYGTPQEKSGDLNG